MTDPLPPDLSVERIENIRKDVDDYFSASDKSQKEESFDEIVFKLLASNGKALYALLQLAHSAASGSEWRPIESAPKDGTPILGAVSDRADGCVYSTALKALSAIKEGTDDPERIAAGIEAAAFSRGYEAGAQDAPPPTKKESDHG